jgi:hypothetical protein
MSLMVSFVRFYQRLLTISVRNQKGVQRGLCLVGLALALAGLDFKRNGESFGLVIVFEDNLHGGIDVPLQAIVGRPNVFFNVKQLIDIHSPRLAVPCSYERIILRLLESS